MRETARQAGYSKSELQVGVNNGLVAPGISIAEMRRVLGGAMCGLKVGGAAGGRSRRERMANRQGGSRDAR